MRRALFAVALVAAFLPPGSAHAAAVGSTCGLDTGNDPTGVVANPNTQVGTEYAGPIAVAYTPSTNDPVAHNPVTVSVTCWVQLQGTGNANDSAAVAAGTVATGPSLPVVGYLPTVEIQYPETVNVWLCTRVDVTDSSGAHTALYADTTDPNGAVLTTDSSQARCAFVTSQSTDPCDVEPSPMCPLPVAARTRRSGGGGDVHSAIPQPIVCVDGADLGTPCVYP